jgi:hypothetical protein
MDGGPGAWDGLVVSVRAAVYIGSVGNIAVDGYGGLAGVLVFDNEHWARSATFVAPGASCKIKKGSGMTRLGWKLFS